MRAERKVTQLLGLTRARSIAALTVLTSCWAGTRGSLGAREYCITSWIESKQMDGERVAAASAMFIFLPENIES